MRAYIRPLGEPNRCLNVYAAYDCAGNPREAGHSPRWYKRAFRRIYVLIHGGGKRSTINARLRDAGLPPLQQSVGGLPKAPVELIWSPLPAGSPTVPQNRPRHFYPGSAGSTGRAPTSIPTTRTGRRWSASTGASRASRSRSPSGESPPATTPPT